MSRPQNKEQLLELSRSEFDKLLNTLETLSEDKITLRGACGEWSIKDILSHLNEWHLMMQQWYEIGMSGKKPEIPAKGYTWKTTPELNEKIYQENKNKRYDKVLKELKCSFAEIQQIIKKHTDSELFSKQKYTWTGSTSLGAYLVSATSSHYAWANTLIKKFLK
jgi:hypothetical protein